MEHYAAVIIGSGQGGTPLAKKFAQAGRKTALIEKKFIGGTCVNYGCTPTKTLLASAQTAHVVAHSQEWGVETGKLMVNMPAVEERKAKIVEKFRSGSHESLSETPNLTLLFGEASLMPENQIKINLNSGGTQIISADKIFIDTGTRPAVPNITGLNEINYLTSDTILNSKEIPAHLVIIGGGYISLEYGQMYQRFGSQVTILKRSGRLMRHEDEDIAAEVENIIREDGIQLLFNAQTTQVDQKEDKILIKVKVGEDIRENSCSHLLIATGRTPNTENLNLPAVGVQTDEKGFIIVNEKLETTAKNIYALGDVKGGPAFTHISYNDYVILYHNLLENKNLTTTNRLVPFCSFTQPQIARVGLTENEAKAQKLNFKIARLPMAQVARAIETGESRGFIKAVLDADTELILGAAVIGPEGGELMTLLQMAMVGKVKYTDIKEMIFAHPLYAEALNNLFLALDEKE